MAAEWETRQLGELTENYDSLRAPVKETDRRPGPFPYYGASGVVDFVDGFLFDGEYLLIAEDGENLRTRKTPVAFLARGKFWVNNHAHIVRGNGAADTRFLMYALSDADISGYLTGSTIPKLTQGNLNRIPLLTPPVEEQRAIARILGTLDDKIDLNRRMSETLEAMARALFRQDCVENPESRSVDAPAGLKHDQWTVAPLGTLLTEIETGSRPKGGIGSFTEGVPSIGAESIVRLGSFDFSKTRYVPRDFFLTMRKGLLKSRDVLLYKDGGRPGEFEPHVSMFGDGFPFHECAINEHVYRLRAASPMTQNFLYFWLSSEASMEEMRVKGTGVAVPGLNSTAVKSLEVRLPPTSRIRAFDSRVEPIVARILLCATESRTLSLLRDALLPRLISGELRVEDAEKLVEAAPV